MELRFVLLREAPVPGPYPFAPLIALRRRDGPGEFGALHAGAIASLGLKRVEIESAIGIVRDNRIRHTAFANEHRQCARVDAADADDAASAEPAIKALGGPIIRWACYRGVEDAPAHAGGSGEICRLDVFWVGADIADMRKGEGDDLAGIGRVGQNFLIARDRRVEANLARRFSRCANAIPLNDQSVCENDSGCVGAIPPCGVPAWLVSDMV